MNRIAFCDNKFERMKEKKRNEKFYPRPRKFPSPLLAGSESKEVRRVSTEIKAVERGNFRRFCRDKHSTFRVGEGGAVSHVDNYHRLGERERGIVLLRECALKFAHSSAQLTITGGVQ